MNEVGGLKRQMLGIHYDKKGVIKKVDVQGMTLEELTRELVKKVIKGLIKEVIEELVIEEEAKKNGSDK